MGPLPSAANCQKPSRESSVPQPFTASSGASKSRINRSAPAGISVCASDTQNKHCDGAYPAGIVIQEASAIPSASRPAGSVSAVTASARSVFVSDSRRCAAGEILLPNTDAAKHIYLIPLPLFSYSASFSRQSLPRLRWNFAR